MHADTIEPKGALTIRTLAMPADTNPAGDIFGGWVMSQMDIAGSICAVERVLPTLSAVGGGGVVAAAPWFPCAMRRATPIRFRARLIHARSSASSSTTRMSGS